VEIVVDERIYVVHTVTRVDVVFFHREQEFVWDGFKAASNLKRYGVTFEQAAAVFFDPVVRFEDAWGGDESRLAAIGIAENSFDVLYVVHLVREDELIRIISARAMTRVR
jgi:uncharacterized DUF497 family protein